MEKRNTVDRRSILNIKLIGDQLIGDKFDLIGDRKTGPKMFCLSADSHPSKY